MRFNTYVGYCKRCSDRVYYQGKDAEGKGEYRCVECGRIDIGEVIWDRGGARGM